MAAIAARYCAAQREILGKVLPIWRPHDPLQPFLNFLKGLKTYERLMDATSEAHPPVRRLYVSCIVGILEDASYFLNQHLTCLPDINAGLRCEPSRHLGLNLEAATCIPFQSFLNDWCHDPML